MKELLDQTDEELLVTIEEAKNILEVRRVEVIVAKDAEILKLYEETNRSGRKIYTRSEIAELTNVKVTRVNKVIQSVKVTNDTLS